MKRTHTADEMNTIRCHAAEIIHILYDAKSVRQLKLLQMQVNVSLEAIEADAVLAAIQRENGILKPPM